MQGQHNKSFSTGNQPTRRSPNGTHSLPVNHSITTSESGNFPMERGGSLTALGTRSEHSPTSRRLISSKGRPSTIDEEKEKLPELPDRFPKQPQRKPPKRSNSLPVGDKKKPKSRSWFFKKWVNHYILISITGLETRYSIKYVSFLRTRYEIFRSYNERSGYIWEAMFHQVSVSCSYYFPYYRRLRLIIQRLIFCPYQRSEHLFCERWCCVLCGEESIPNRLRKHFF